MGSFVLVLHLSGKKRGGDDPTRKTCHCGLESVQVYGVVDYDLHVLWVYHVNKSPPGPWTPPITVLSYWSSYRSIGPCKLEHVHAIPCPSVPKGMARPPFCEETTCASAPQYSTLWVKDRRSTGLVQWPGADPIGPQNRDSLGLGCVCS
jgi:hypothetical protein